MAGGSSSIANIFNSNKPAKGTTEKKKRKRPSKKVPTTVVETNSNNFMNTVQKLTGSADEVNAMHQAQAPKSSSPSPYPSPYSSPSNIPHAEEPPPPPQQQSYYQQYSSSAMDDDVSRSYNSYNVAAPTYSTYNQAGHVYPGYVNYVGYAGSSSRDHNNNVDQDDLYNQHQSSYSGRYDNNSSNDTSDHVSYSRAMENDISPFSWRDPMNHNSTSDYWYHVDPAMRA